ncbi:hypothetical protein Ocin01_06412 [Orchesella cincta]|uniref:Uncharacterized protein n=1 Tax=Orchesella cincta TaxID=48709 RepID=A0A1D2N4Q3_ORCCI|nr:hypothetical protein Ocin01_06412 [Orchesella cincta]
MASQRVLTIKMLLFVIPVILSQPTNTSLSLTSANISEVRCRSDPTTVYQLKEVSEQSVVNHEPKNVSKPHYFVGVSGLDQQMRTLMDESKPCVNTLNLPISNITVFHNDTNNANNVYYYRINNFTLGNTGKFLSLDFFGNGQTLQYTTSNTVLKAGNESPIHQRLCCVNKHITIVTILPTDSSFITDNQLLLESIKEAFCNILQCGGTKSLVSNTIEVTKEIDSSLAVSWYIAIVLSSLAIVAVLIDITLVLLRRRNIIQF